MPDSLPLSSPCRGVCRLGEDQVCDGCGRTIDEIAAWSWLAEGARALVLARVAGWLARDRPAG